jgi:hypothetical protein
VLAPEDRPGQYVKSTPNAIPLEHSAAAEASGVVAAGDGHPSAVQAIDPE